MIAIIDYGAGNLKSVKKAFDYLKVKSKVVSAPEEVADAEKIVLPGVGAFGAAVQKLYETDFFSFLQQWIAEDRPFLGICLGLQLLMEKSSESAGVSGLGVFKGKCRRFEQDKVPQIGWNQVNIQKVSRLIQDIDDQSFFYFLHGYFIQPVDENIVTATTSYGVTYPSIVERGNVFAVQFHPEKSGDIGLKLLKNWVELC